MRVGTTTPGPGDYDMTSWRHLACQKKKPASLAELGGFGTLSTADESLVQAWYAGDVATVAAAKRKADEAYAAAASTSTPKKAKPTTPAAATTPTTSSKSPSTLSDETAQRDAAEGVFCRMNIADLKNCARASATSPGLSCTLAPHTRTAPLPLVWPGREG